MNINLSQVVITSPSSIVGGIVYITKKTSLCAKWFVSNPTLSSVHQYFLSLCLLRDEHYCPISERDLNNRTSVCIEEPPVAEGVKYFVRVMIKNIIGHSSTVDSSLIIIDTTPPNVGNIIISNPKDRNYEYISTDILVEWNGFNDVESSISKFELCVGTNPGRCDTTDLISFYNNTKHQWSGLNTANKKEYFVSIKATNNARLSTNFSFSAPFSVDTTGKITVFIFLFVYD